MPVAKRKPVPANRRARRAAGVTAIEIKRPRPPSGAALVAALRRLICENDSHAVESPGIMMGERGWLYHRNGDYAYAVAQGKTRVTLHLMPMYCDPSIHKAYAGRVRGGDFGKGCIRFKFDAEPEWDKLTDLVRRCAQS